MLRSFFDYLPSYTPNANKCNQMELLYKLYAYLSCENILLEKEPK